MYMSDEPVRVEKGNVKGMTAIAVQGPFNGCDAGITEILEEALAAGEKQIAFDLSATTYLSSPGIACLIKVLKRIQEIDGSLFIHGATADMAELLKLARLNTYLRFT
jgi:anti-anti-sigma factor